MAESQNRPASPEQAPDPSFNYERSHPDRESGGQLDDKSIAKATPAPSSDKMAGAVKNAQDPSHSLASQDAAGPSGAGTPIAHAMVAPQQPDHSMKDEEPLGWDQAPSDIPNPRAQRHPRTGGEGGTPNVGQAERDS